MIPTVIRPQNGLLFIALQASEGTAAAIDPAVHAVAVEDGSVSLGSPFGMEAVSEANGSYVTTAPIMFGQVAPLSFRARIRGAGQAYSATLKPPLYAAFHACGIRGAFTPTVTFAATAGTANSVTLPVAALAAAQAYRGHPFLITAGAGAGQAPLVVSYSAARVALLTEAFAPPLDATTTLTIPATWTFAGTSPRDAAARLSDHPCATVAWYEDGNLHMMIDVRGSVDMEGQSTRPGFATFNMTGARQPDQVAAMPSTAVVATQSAPTLVKGAGLPAAILVDGQQLPISRWSIKRGGAPETPDDPNSRYGFAGGQITRRTPMFEADPLRTLVTTQNYMAQVGAAVDGAPVINSIVARFGSVAGNRWAFLATRAQPVSSEPQMRGQLRADQVGWQCLDPGIDTAGRDGELYLAFS